MNLTFNHKIKKTIINKNSNLCIGLDIDEDRMPSKMDKTINGLESYLKDVIDSTVDLCASYKLNMAFYERYGSKGYKMMENILSYINNRSLTIADGKRGDIGNTTRKYAISIFDTIGFDSITVSPYMGADSIVPFIQNKSKGVFVLCLTSNPSSSDVQLINDSRYTVFERISLLANKLNINDNVGLVVGATKTDYMKKIRMHSDLPWLIPGIGAQGGNLEESVTISNVKESIGLINVSRGILFAGDCNIKIVRQSALEYNKKINQFIKYEKN